MVDLGESAGVMMMSPAFDLLLVTSTGVLGLGVSVIFMRTRPMSGEYTGTYSRDGDKKSESVFWSPFIKG